LARMFAAANLQIRPLPLSLIVESGDSTQRFYYAHTFIESALELISKIIYRLKPLNRLVLQ
jgi:hypothetical protein